MNPLRIGNFVIRRAESRDTDAAYFVCLATGDAGRGAEHLYDDPKALGHIYVGPYLAWEPELAFVVEDPQGVCGYVLGALETKKFFNNYVNHWLPELRRRHPEPEGDPAVWNATQRAYHKYYYPDLFAPEPRSEYPSHLHIDLLPRVQGRGLGVEMMNVLLNALTERGSPGVHLGMAPSNARAERFYKQLGFTELVRTAEDLYLGRRLVHAPFPAPI